MTRVLKCNRCGAVNNVFHDAVYDENNNTYTLVPTCINCKKADLEIKDVLSWEEKLKVLETYVAEQLIEWKFGNIKFKNSAKKTLVNLMRKYSVRTVFEICMGLDATFNPHLIAQRCEKIYKQ